MGRKGNGCSCGRPMQEQRHVHTTASPLPSLRTSSSAPAAPARASRSAPVRRGRPREPCHRRGASTPRAPRLLPCTALQQRRRQAGTRRRRGGGGGGVRGHAPAAANRSDSSDAAAPAPPSRRASASMRAWTACAICSAVSALTASPIFMCTLLQGGRGGRMVKKGGVNLVMDGKGSASHHWSQGGRILTTAPPPTSARRGFCVRNGA